MYLLPLIILCIPVSLFLLLFYAFLMSTSEDKELIWGEDDWKVWEIIS